MKKLVAAICFSCVLFGTGAVFTPALSNGNDENQQVLNDLKKVKAFIPEGRPAYIRFTIVERSSGNSKKIDTVSIWNDGKLYRMKTAQVEMLHNSKSQIRVDHQAKIVYMGTSLSNEYFKAFKQMDFNSLHSLLKAKTLTASFVSNTPREARIRFVSKNKFATYELAYLKKNYKPTSYSIKLSIDKQQFQSDITFLDYRLLKKEERSKFDHVSFLKGFDGSKQSKSKLKGYKIVKI